MGGLQFEASSVEPLRVWADLVDPLLLSVLDFYFSNSLPCGRKFARAKEVTGGGKKKEIIGR